MTKPKAPTKTKPKNRTFGIPGAIVQVDRVSILTQQLRDLEKAHAELQKFYTQSQDELHACRERELMRPWWKKLLGLR